MKRFLFCFLLLNIYVEGKLQESPHVTFDESMGYPKMTYGLIAKDDVRWWQVWQDIYAYSNPAVKTPSLETKIPKIIHQVWLGPAPFPFEAARQSILKHHPGWQYKLWTDADVEAFGLVNKKLFDAARNYGERSDIFRYEILHRYGGVYLDADIECIKSLEELHYKYSFYTGILNTSHVELGIGVIGAAPRDPIITRCINAMQDSGSKTDFNDIMFRTGPMHFTKCFVALVEQYNGEAIALPTGYFYPIPNTEKTCRTLTQAARWIRPETFTVHYWGCTWQRPAAFVATRR